MDASEKLTSKSLFRSSSTPVFSALYQQLPYLPPFTFWMAPSYPGGELPPKIFPNQPAILNSSTSIQPIGPSRVASSLGKYYSTPIEMQVYPQNIEGYKLHSRNHELICPIDCSTNNQKRYTELPYDSYLGPKEQAIQVNDQLEHNCLQSQKTKSLKFNKIIQAYESGSCPECLRIGIESPIHSKSTQKTETCSTSVQVPERQSDSHRKRKAAFTMCYESPNNFTSKKKLLIHETCPECNKAKRAGKMLPQKKRSSSSSTKSCDWSKVSASTNEGNINPTFNIAEAFPVQLSSAEPSTSTSYSLSSDTTSEASKYTKIPKNEPMLLSTATSTETPKKPKVKIKSSLARSKVSKQQHNRSTSKSNKKVSPEEFPSDEYQSSAQSSATAMTEPHIANRPETKKKWPQRLCYCCLLFLVLLVLIVAVGVFPVVKRVIKLQL